MAERQCQPTAGLLLGGSPTHLCCRGSHRSADDGPSYYLSLASNAVYNFRL